VPTAIRTSGTVHVLLHFTSHDLKRRVAVVVRREVPTKGEVLFYLRGSEPKNFSQVGNHVLRISTANANLKALLGTATLCSRQIAKMVVC